MEPLTESLESASGPEHSATCVDLLAFLPGQLRRADRRQNGSWQVSVSDNGIGMDATYHEQIFGIFKRLHSASQYSGAGLRVRAGYRPSRASLQCHLTMSLNPNVTCLSQALESGDPNGEPS
jgi:hypothetical protein